MLVPRYFEDLSLLHLGTLPARAYYIPDSGIPRTVVDREASDRFQLLNAIRSQWPATRFNQDRAAATPVLE